MISNQVLIPLLLALIGGLLLMLDSESLATLPISLADASKGPALRLPGRVKVRTRLEKIGREGEYESFLLKQFIATLFTAVCAFSFLLLLTGSPILASSGSLLLSTLVFYLIDRQLTGEVIKYRLGIESEFAAVIEMLTLSLSAGESPLGAMTRISQRSHGLLAHEFGIVIAAVRKGASFHLALDDFGRRVNSIVIRRFVDALITAMLRGAPLVDVLARYAAEARQHQRNILMDKAGKAEISMMVPVVFLILPISVLFALWPSLTRMNLFAA